MPITVPPIPASPTAASLINVQQQYASNTVLAADDFLSVLAEFAQPLEITITGLPDPQYINRDNSQLAKSLLLSLQPTAPGILPIEEESPTFEDPTFSPVEAVPVSDFTKVAPDIQIPQAPDATLPVPPTAPSISDPALPSAPVISLPSAPVIAGLDLPLPPSLDLPVFSSTAPIDDLVVPSNNFVFFEQAYESDMLDELKAKLIIDLIEGGYGIETDDEQLLFDRARDRENASANAALDTTFSEMAARGFPFPPGDLMVAVARNRQELSNKISSINRDITIKRGDLFVENRRFTIEQARQLESTLIGFHSSVMERSLNAARATLEASIAVYNANVARFNARLEAHRTEAQVFEARVRAALANVEVYRTTMEGKRIESDIQRNQVALYTAQIEAANSVVGLYRTQMEAASVQAQIERTRLDAFRALVDAYTSQVQAKVSEFGMFEARIRGETAKIQAFQAEAEAYGSVVQSQKIKADIAIRRNQAELEQNAQRVNVFQARLEKYRADLQAQATTVNALIARYNGDVSAYTSVVGALAEAYRLEQQAQSLQDTVQARNAEIAIKNAQIVYDGLKTVIDARIKSSAYAVDYYKAVSAGAVNAISVLASLAE